MGYTRQFVVYNPKFGSVRDKMSGTQTLQASKLGEEYEKDTFNFIYHSLLFNTL